MSTAYGGRRVNMVALSLTSRTYPRHCLVCALLRHRRIVTGPMKALVTRITDQNHALKEQN